MTPPADIRALKNPPLSRRNHQPGLALLNNGVSILQLSNIYRTFNTNNVSFWTCNPPTTLHAGKHNIPRKETYVTVEFIHRVVL